MPTLPLAVVVSGMGGSGKTTLARRIADEMALPHLNKDVCVAAMLRSGLSYAAAHLPALRIYYATAQSWLASSMSLVMDTTLAPEFSIDEVGSLRPHGAVVNVHCRATDALARWEAKMQRDHGEAARAIIEARRGVWELGLEPLDLQCPRIDVDTTNDYSPPLPEVVGRIEELHAAASLR